VKKAVRNESSHSGIAEAGGEICRSRPRRGPDRAGAMAGRGGRGAAKGRPHLSRVHRRGVTA